MLGIKLNISFRVKKNLITFFVFFIVIGLITIIYHVTGANKIYILKSSKDELNVKQKILQIKENNFVQYADNLRLLEGLNVENNLLYKKILNADFTPHGIVDISKILESSHITETRFNIICKEAFDISSLSDEEEVFIYKIKICGLGKYEDILDFLENINKAEVHYKINTFFLSDKEMNGDNDMYLEILVSIYSLEDKTTTQY